MLHQGHIYTLVYFDAKQCLHGVQAQSTTEVEADSVPLSTVCKYSNGELPQNCAQWHRVSFYLLGLYPVQTLFCIKVSKLYRCALCAAYLHAEKAEGIGFKPKADLAEA